MRTVLVILYNVEQPHHYWSLSGSELQLTLFEKELASYNLWTREFLLSGLAPESSYAEDCRPDCYSERILKTLRGQRSALSSGQNPYGWECAVYEDNNAFLFETFPEKEEGDVDERHLLASSPILLAEILTRRYSRTHFGLGYQVLPATRDLIKTQERQHVRPREKSQRQKITRRATFSP